MQISNNIEAIDLALWIKDKRILIVSDIHLGLEESMHLKGIMVPKQQSELIIQSFKKIFTKVSPRTIIINGDLKHNFGKNLKQEWDDTLKLIDFLKENCRELIFIKGMPNPISYCSSGKLFIGFYNSNIHISYKFITPALTVRVDLKT